MAYQCIYLVSCSRPNNANAVQTLGKFLTCFMKEHEVMAKRVLRYLQEGHQMLAQLRDQLIMVPELSELHPECDIDQADVGVPGETSPEDESRMRAILKRHRKIFLGDENAAPAPARGVGCDLDVGDAKYIALRPRSIEPHVAVKVFELLKKLLEINLIDIQNRNGHLQWMCINNRHVNNFIYLSSNPLRLIDDLLVGFEKALWLMSLDMSSGVLGIRMT
ncbi:reverse transcriptase [Phytophthora megakarya]|uniref:Reverse transcriptase n=1 Tax=Phytophthora megakarya TaxID=4795 RepID=A0A225WE12_9STRA|nr:reverse transcriptase [Phytophthora megakarya]